MLKAADEEKLGARHLARFRQATIFGTTEKRDLAERTQIFRMISILAKLSRTPFTGSIQQFDLKGALGRRNSLLGPIDSLFAPKNSLFVRGGKFCERNWISGPITQSQQRLCPTLPAISL